MPDIKLIVGLGNPGDKYAGTRHNAGFEAADLLAERWEGRWREERKFNALIAAPGGRPMLAKPLTYMNNSGESVRTLLDYYKILPGEMIVISDDFTLPLGAVRLRKAGSDGGHNGLYSIIQHAGTNEFPRLRLGIGPVPPMMDPADFVLMGFPKAERDEADRMSMEAADAVEAVISQGWDSAISRMKPAK